MIAWRSSLSEIVAPCRCSSLRETAPCSLRETAPCWLREIAPGAEPPGAEPPGAELFVVEPFGPDRPETRALLVEGRRGEPAGGVGEREPG